MPEIGSTSVASWGCFRCDVLYEGIYLTHLIRCGRQKGSGEEISLFEVLPRGVLGGDLIVSLGGHLLFIYYLA